MTNDRSELQPAEQMSAMDHLGGVLLILQNLSPMDGCTALDEAREFYNRLNPDNQIHPMAGWVTRLMTIGPMDWPLVPDEVSPT